GPLPRPDAAHPRQGEEGQLGPAHHPDLRRRPPAERPRRRLPRRRRPDRAGAGAGRFQAGPWVEGRRAGGPVRHRPRPHADRVGPATAGEPLTRDTRTEEITVRTVTGIVLAGGVLFAAAFAAAQPPGGRGGAPRADDVDSFVARMLAFDT